jgi:hypothetical protein
MMTRFVCLANSLKEGGRCVAGIELDANHQPVYCHELPKWIRPICPTRHGEIPEYQVISFDLLDVLEMNVTGPKVQGYQTENVSFDPPFTKVGTFNIAGLAPLCDQRNALFGNHAKAISIDCIAELNHSLVLICTNHLHIELRKTENRKNKPQLRAGFEHCGIFYDLPVTDPIFRERIINNPHELVDKDIIYLCVSIGIPYEGWHYKLVAGVFY